MSQKMSKKCAKKCVKKCAKKCPKNVHISGPVKVRNSKNGRPYSKPYHNLEQHPLGISQPRFFLESRNINFNDDVSHDGSSPFADSYIVEELEIFDTKTQRIMGENEEICDLHEAIGSHSESARHIGFVDGTKLQLRPKRTAKSLNRFHAISHKRLNLYHAGERHEVKELVKREFEPLLCETTDFQVALDNLRGMKYSKEDLC